jgi:hypothetical protein
MPPLSAAGLPASISVKLHPPPGPARKRQQAALGKAGPAARPPDFAAGGFFLYEIRHLCHHVTYGRGDEVQIFWKVLNT